MLVGMAPARPLALVSSMIGFGGVSAYVAIMAGEGDNSLRIAVPIALGMLVATALALVGTFAAQPSIARGSLIAATIVFGIVGFLGLFTIGIIFVIAAALSGAALGRMQGQRSGR